MEIDPRCRACHHGADVFAAEVSRLADHGQNPAGLSALLAANAERDPFGIFEAFAVLFGAFLAAGAIFAVTKAAAFAALGTLSASCTR